jgi:hypothetical protein
MTDEDLDRIADALLPLAVAGHVSARARSVAARFNEQLEEARARVRAAREARARDGSISAELQNELRGYAIMLAEERSRIALQWGLSTRPPR